MAGLDTFADFDATHIAIFGETITYTPVDPPSTPVSIKGIWFNPSRPIEELHAPVRTQANLPSVLLHRDDLAQPKRGDTLVRTGAGDPKTYIVDMVERDEGGLWLLNLRET